jgi:regulatory protein RepA
MIEIRKRAAKLPPIEDLADFLKRDIPVPPALIRGVMRQGDSLILGSSSKSYKTFTLLDLGLSIAHGIPWIGFDTAKGKVLFINFELKPHSIKKRIQDILEARSITYEPGTFEIWNLRGKAEQYDVIIPAIVERIKSRRFSAVILDPLYKLLGDLDENCAGDMNKLMNELEQVTIEAGASIILATHYSKGNQAGKNPMDRISGSGVLTGRAGDKYVNLTPHEEDKSYTVEVTVRDFAPVEPFVITFEHPVMVRNEKLNPKKLKTAISKVPLYTVDDLIKMIAVECLTKAELKEKAVNQVGMSDSKFYDLYRELERVDGVTLSPRTKKLSYNNPTSAAKLN